MSDTNDTIRRGHPDHSQKALAAFSPEVRREEPSVFLYGEGEREKLCLDFFLQKLDSWNTHTLKKKVDEEQLYTRSPSYNNDRSTSISFLS
ncbi:hypothetical protein JTE90_015162 [Oedothorax gibbosus]|uniref:Uncharacterized protein n=1 Tax=Oedothorax gibbosus TaxID=931172 RepID=A0AAV6V9I2_9ARAC|nr:hypothetical protein JTE90_015162 [Oedothorax gibbosus]